MSELSAIENTSNSTPTDLLNIAVTQGADVEKLDKLMQLQERWEKREAEKAYHQAIANFKSESITILKNKTNTYTNSKGETVTYKNPTLDHIIEIVSPLLSKYGLSHRWDTEQGEGGRITVTCVLTHALGHSETNALSGSPDDSGKKNNIQRIGSTVTYLERYTFLGLVGLAAKDQDDDGEASGERQGYSDGFAKALEYAKAWYKHKEVIENVKEQLADDNLLGAAEYLYSLTNAELNSIHLAPTKGGIFTLEEKKKMVGEEWEEARTKGIELNPGVDRSI